MGLATDDLVEYVVIDYTVNIAYIKPIPTGDSNLYAVHSSDGRQLAVFESYDSAFFAARQYNFAPVSVH